MLFLSYYNHSRTVTAYVLIYTSSLLDIIYTSSLLEVKMRIWIWQKWEIEIGNWLMLNLNDCLYLLRNGQG